MYKVYQYIQVHTSTCVGTQRRDIFVTRMATIGKLGKFCTDVEDWSQYSVRMEFYLVVNGVTGDAKKKAAFLSAIGPSIYKLLQSLIYDWISMISMVLYTIYRTILNHSRQLLYRELSSTVTREREEGQ